jgi:NodT family efflux transporter outer membrane factor (OMF) lipoprotein
MPSLNKIRPLASALMATALSAGVLAACAEVGPQFQAPAAPKTSGYAMQGDAASNVPQLAAAASDTAGDWWTAFGSPDLNKTVRQALTDSPTLAAADATLAQSREAVGAARSALGPQGDFSAGAEYTRVNFASFGITVFPNPTIGLYSLGANVSYDLDLFGGAKRNVESAQAIAEAQKHSSQAAYLMLSGNVALQAVQIATLRAQIAAVRSVIDLDQKNLDFVRKLQAGGGAAPSAQVSARAQMVQDQALLPDLNRQLAQARHALALLVGHAPNDWTAPDFDLETLRLPASIPVELPSELVRRRPDILQAEAALHAATANVGVQQAKLYPDIKLNAAFTQTALTPDKLADYGFSGWNLGPNLVVPIFGRKALKANQRAAEAAARAAFAQYQETVLTAFTQVADVMQALASDEQAVAAQDEARKVAEQDLKDSQFAYQNGGGNLLEVTQSQRRLSETRQAYALAQGRRYADAVRLYVATAADWRAAGQTAAR